VDAGDTVSPFYDPMLAKVIAHGATRQIALTRLAQTLTRTAVVGPRTNVGFLASLCEQEAFRRGGVDTRFIDNNLAALGAVHAEADPAAVASGVAWLVNGDAARMRELSSVEDAAESPWDAMDGFQLSGSRVVAIPVMANGEAMVAAVSYGTAGITITVDRQPPAADAQIFAGPC
jgi:3-methylcrotonyl-CoA carboxylase alpha subunit